LGIIFCVRVEIGIDLAMISIDEEENILDLELILIDWEQKIMGMEMKIMDFERKIIGKDEKIMDLRWKLTDKERKIMGTVTKIMDSEKNIIDWYADFFNRNGIFLKKVRFCYIGSETGTRLLAPIAADILFLPF